jgi:hypothetical protein
MKKNDNVTMFLGRFKCQKINYLQRKDRTICLHLISCLAKTNFYFHFCFLLIHISKSKSIAQLKSVKYTKHFKYTFINLNLLIFMGKK